MEKDLKSQILESIIESSKSVDWNNTENFTASCLAEKLSASRNVVSQYLNEYVNDKLMVKVNTRPVLFFSKASLCNECDSLKDSYDSLDDLKSAVSKNSNRSISFTKLIGHQGSLNSIIQHCKSAITYPGSGLPILLLGNTGVGKSLIAQTMYEYGCEKNVFSESSRFITVNCSEYANNPEFFLTNLFGCKKGAYTGADKDREGLISLADGGMLFLDEVHCLSSECQEKLFLFMDKGIYHMVGDNEKWYQASEHLVFATTEDPKTVLLKTLYRRIPITTYIPALHERPKQEKRELLSFLLAKESQQIKKEIRVTSRFYRILSEVEYSENIGQLSNCIKASVASAYVNSNKEEDSYLKLDMNNIPETILVQAMSEGLLNRFSETTELTLEEIKKDQQKELKLYLFNNDILSLYEQYASNNEELNIRLQRRFSQYLDSIYFTDQNKLSVKELMYHGVIEKICERLSKKYQVTFQNNEIIALCRLLDDLVLNVSSLDNQYHNNSMQILKLIQDLRGYNERSVEMSQEFFVLLKQLLNLEFNALAILDGIIFLRVLSNRVIEKETRCMILSHGYSTASSLAAAANHMLDEELFDAIDMPMDVTVFTIVAKLNEYIDRQRHLRDLIILVDMGSLENIYKRIQVKDHINIVIFNNVTIKLALDIGNKVQQNYSVQRIMETIHQKDYLNNAVLIENRKKEKAILSVCNTGITTAEKICSLVEESLPRKIDCNIIAYNFDHIVESGIDAPIFHQYDVQYILGTMDPHLEGYTFISVEDIIEKQNIEKIRLLMGSLLSEQELEDFSQNIIKNFSLQNLLDYLTILNPKKIVSYVEEILDVLQQKLNLTMQSNTMVGLYLHVSCLIERLITDKYITNYDHLDQFILNNQDFIEIVKDAFKNLEKHYCVEIPVSEIAYIYDYIYRLPSVANRTNSVEQSFFQ